MRYLILISLLFSFSAFACPEFNGQYECKRNNDVFSRTFETISGGYHITKDGITNEYSTDGVTVHEVPDTDSMTDGKYSSFCEGDKFIVNFSATIWYEGVKIGRQTTKSTYQLKNDNIEITHKIKMKGMPIPTQKEVCTLQ